MKSARIQDYVVNLLSEKQTCSVQEMKDYINHNENESFSEGQFSGSINTLLRNGTIKKVERGVYTLKARQEDMKKCFVISPIGEAGSETRKRADQLFNYIIKPVCEECEFNPIRVDQINASDSINQTILDHLKDDELVVADMTGHNPNAFYEMGYRSALNKPIIHLRYAQEDIPFDVSSIRAFDYDLSDLDSVANVKDRLIKTIKRMSFVANDENEGESEIAVNQDFMQMMYAITDKLDDIEAEIKKNNSETIKTIIKTYTDSASQKQESTENIMTRMVMEQLLKNPSSADTLMMLADKFNNAK